MGVPFTCAGPGNPEDWIRNAEKAPQNSLNCWQPDSAENQHSKNEAQAKKEINDKDEIRDKKEIRYRKI